MALPTSTVPLRNAVSAALTTDTGKTNAIPAGFLFRKAVRGSTAQRSVTLKEGPTAWVVVRDHRAIADRLLLEMSTVRALTVVVEILCEYYAGHELFGAEHDAAVLRIEADRVRVIKALLYPEALALDPDGNETGLDGGSLRFDGYTSIGPTPPGKTRVMSVTHFFTATLELDNT